jgi:2-phosphoglycerate kinase
VRAFFSKEFLPSVHHSSFNVARALNESGKNPHSTITGFLRQVADVAPGIDALVQRAVSERSRIVIEGIHLLPEVPRPDLREQAITVQALLTVEDEQSHRAHFYMRGLEQPRPPERYLEAFDRIRELQDYLLERAQEAGIPTIDERGLEQTIKQVMGLVLDAVGTEPIPPAQ